MTSKLIASVVALSIGFAGLTTVPAQANDDVAKILAGIATVVIIGKVIEARNDRADSTTRRDTYDRDGRRWDRANRNRKLLPEQCQDRVRRRGEWFSYYGARCLQRHGNDRAYPQACLRDIRTGRGRHRDVYGARCLLREGYREARRGH